MGFSVEVPKEGKGASKANRAAAWEKIELLIGRTAWGFKRIRFRMWSQVLWNWLGWFDNSFKQPAKKRLWMAFDLWWCAKLAEAWQDFFCGISWNFKPRNLAWFSDGFLATCSLKRGKNHIARPLLEPLLVTEGAERHSSRFGWRSRWCFFWWTVLSINAPKTGGTSSQILDLGCGTSSFSKQPRT